MKTMQKIKLILFAMYFSHKSYCGFSHALQSPNTHVSHSYSTHCFGWADNGQGVFFNLYANTDFPLLNSTHQPIRPSKISPRIAIEKSRLWSRNPLAYINEMEDKRVDASYRMIIIIIGDRVRHGRCNNFQVPPTKQENPQGNALFWNTCSYGSRAKARIISYSHYHNSFLEQSFEAIRENWYLDTNFTKWNEVSL